MRNSTTHYKIYKIKIFFSKIVLLSHPIFCEEDYICAELKLAYSEYTKQINRAYIPHLKEKISTMAIQLDEFDSIKDPGFAKESEKVNLKMQFDEAINKLEEEKEKINEKANLLYNKWLELKKIRQNNNNSASTNVTLKVMKFPVR